MINLVIDILKANTTLTNLVDADNIYPLIQLQGGTIPSVVVQLTNTDPNDTQDKVSTYDNNSVEVTCMAISPAAAWGISEAVRAALDGYTGGLIAQVRFVTQATDIFESTEVFSVTQGYSVHLKRDGATLPTAIAGLGEFNLDDINNVDNEVVNALDRQALVYDEATSQWIADGVGQVVIPVRNPSRDTPIAVGTVLKATGAQGDRILVAPFEPATDDMKYFVGIASEVLGATNDTKDGHAQVYGELRNIDTDTFEVGDVLYAAAGGTLSTTENQYPIAIVTRKQQNTGRIFIRMWTPGKGYHQRYRTQASAKMFVGVGATVELYYTATADGDGFVTQDLTAAVGEGNTEERVLRYKSGAFGESNTAVGYTDAGIATDATYAEMLTAFNNLLATESAPITVYATRTEVAGRSGLLADYPGAAAAYSLRLLDTDYTGSAIRVRRASDNAEQDIGFDGNGDLDATALATFCSGTNGFVKVWYDQAGANDATQTTTTAQPKIYDSSTGVVTENGKPALQFDGSDDRFPFDNSELDIGSLSSFTVGKYTNTSNSQMMLGLSGSVGNKRWYAPYLTVGNFNYGYGSEFNAMETTADTNQNLHTLIAGSTLGSAEAFFNSSSLGTQTLDSGIDVTNSGIMNLTSALYSNGNLQEVIVYDSDQSANRTGIESNVNTYYSIYS